MSVEKARVAYSHFADYALIGVFTAFLTLLILVFAALVQGYVGIFLTVLAAIPAWITYDVYEMARSYWYEYNYELDHE